MRVEFVTGKGGVGKSAVTAAMARLHARSGARVMAVSMLPGGGLGPHLGLPGLSPKPAPGVDGVHAMEVRRIDALNQYIRLYSPFPALARLGKAVQAFDSLATAAPGIRELITLGKVLYDAREWDRVIVDAVPTGQIASYLRAPDVIAGLIPSGRVAEQTAKLKADLSERTTVHIVSIGEELPVTETVEALAEFESLPPARGEVITNRMMAPLPETASISGVELDAATLQNSLATSQARWRSELPDGPALPYLFGVLDPLVVSDLLSEALEAW